MMLATIADFKPNMTLVQNSGIQFLDFALTPDLNNDWPGKFVRQTANGPLLRLNYHAASAKYLLPQAAGTPAEVVKPEFSFPLAQSLRLLCGQWLPLPFFRFNPPRTFIGGPDNWARVRSWRWTSRMPAEIRTVSSWLSTPGYGRTARMKRWR